MLDDYPTRSGYLITPVVIWAEQTGPLRPNPEEVASVHRTFCRRNMVATPAELAGA